MNTVQNNTRFIKTILSVALLAAVIAGTMLLRKTETYAQAGGTHLHVVMRVTKDGKAEVVRATELPGAAILSDAPTGNFAYEVTNNNQTVAVETLSDPFVQRSFPGPAGSQMQGHSFSRAEAATIIVKIPQASLAGTELDRISLRLHKLNLAEPLERMDVSTFQRLQKDQRVEPLAQVSSQLLALQLRAKGRKVTAQ